MEALAAAREHERLRLRPLRLEEHVLEQPVIGTGPFGANLQPSLMGTGGYPSFSTEIIKVFKMFA